jgi:hypothetical protein
MITNKGTSLEKPNIKSNTIATHKTTENKTADFTFYSVDSV